MPQAHVTIVYTSHMIVSSNVYRSLDSGMVRIY